MGFSRMHTARKPVGSGSLARSTAEHSPAIGQMKASPYINASTNSPHLQQTPHPPLNPRLHSSESVKSDEFFDTGTPTEELPNPMAPSGIYNTLSESMGPGAPSAVNIDSSTAERIGSRPDLNRPDVKMKQQQQQQLQQQQQQPSTAPQPTAVAPLKTSSQATSAEPAPRNVAKVGPLLYSERKKSSGTHNTAHEARQPEPQTGADATGWYPPNNEVPAGYTNPDPSQAASTYAAAYSQPAQDYGYVYAQYGGQPDVYNTAGNAYVPDGIEQYQQYQQYLQQYDQGYDAQTYGYAQDASSQVYGMDNNVYGNAAANSSGMVQSIGPSSTSDLSIANAASTYNANASNTALPNVPFNPEAHGQAYAESNPSQVNRAGSVQSTQSSRSTRSTNSSAGAKPGVPSSRTPSARPASAETGLQTDPAASIYSQRSAQKSASGNLSLQMNTLNARNSSSDLSPHSSSAALNTPTSVVSQQMSTMVDSPISVNTSEQSVGRGSSSYGTNSSGALSSSSHGQRTRSLDAQSEYQNTPVTQSSIVEEPEEQKDAALGIGIGSAYVQRMRADAGETHITRQPLNLPIGLRRTAKSAPINLKSDFVRRAMDIRYTHLPQRMLETEVDDDDDEDNVSGHAVPNGEPSFGQSSRLSVADSLDSQRESVAASHRSSSPVDLVTEQTGKIKLFVANPDDD